MTTSAEVRAAWEAHVWQSDVVQLITPNVFMYDVSTDSSYEVAKLLHETEVNFFTCRVQRTTEHLPVSQTRYTFEVRVEYYRQQTDVSESTFNSVIDRLEAVDGLVRTSLGKTWNGTVDFFQGGRPAPIVEVTIDGRGCWRGSFVYTATKTI